MRKGSSCQRNNNVYSRGSIKSYSRGSMNNVQVYHINTTTTTTTTISWWYFTREAEQRMKERIAAAATKIAVLKRMLNI